MILRCIRTTGVPRIPTHPLPALRRVGRGNKQDRSVHPVRKKSRTVRQSVPTARIRGADGSRKKLKKAEPKYTHTGEAFYPGLDAFNESAGIIAIHVGDKVSIIKQKNGWALGKNETTEEVGWFSSAILNLSPVPKDTERSKANEVDVGTYIDGILSHIDPNDPAHCKNSEQTTRERSETKDDDESETPRLTLASGKSSIDKREA